MKDIHIYDIATRTWYTQQATGFGNNVPPDRKGACAVVASAPDRSSHNIYVFGGISGSEIFKEVWVLTLPTFQWVRTQSGYDKLRSDHTCTKVRGIYMLVYRGFTNGCDINAGVQLMDLTTLDWDSKIGPGGGDQGDEGYKVPEKIYSIIGGG